MFTGRVDRVKRGFWGPKFKTIWEGQSIHPEPIEAELSKYRGPGYRTTLTDHTESLGDYRPPADSGVTEYDLDDIPDDVDADHIDASTRRAYVFNNVDEDIPF